MYSECAVTLYIEFHGLVELRSCYGITSFQKALAFVNIRLLPIFGGKDIVCFSSTYPANLSKYADKGRGMV
jgi:hypothetical protein